MENAGGCKAWKFPNLKCAVIFHSRSIQASWYFIWSHTFFAAGIWPHSVDTNYICNLLCRVFWSSAKITIILCHTVLISIGAFVTVTSKTLVWPNPLRFFKDFKPTQSGPVFMRLAEKVILAVSQVAPQPSWRWGKAPKTIVSQPYLWEPGMLLHWNTQIDLVGSYTASHGDSYRLFNVTILLLLYRSFPDLCCGSSYKALKFSQLALTAKPCS